MDRFSGVRPISPATVFRRRSRHGRYIRHQTTGGMRVPPKLWLRGAQERCNQFVGPRNGVSVRLPLTLTTDNNTN